MTEEEMLDVRYTSTLAKNNEAVLRERLAELRAQQEAAPGWGAAVGARHEEIQSIEHQLRTSPVSALADKIDLHLQLSSSPGFHLSTEDLQMAVKALRGLAQSSKVQIAAPSNDQLSKLWNAIVEHTKGDGFWIGEILLTTLEREVGFNPAALADTSTDRGGK